MMLLKMNKIIILLLLLFSFPIVKAQCQGCLFNDKCIDIGEQRISTTGSQVYCGNNHNMVPAKSDGESCQENYECINFYCKNNQCSSVPIPVEEKSNYFNFAIYSLIFILILSLIYYLYKSNILSSIIKIKKEPKKEALEKKPKFGLPSISSYSSRYKSPLEKELKKTSEELKRLSKKK